MTRCEKQPKKIRSKTNLPLRARAASHQGLIPLPASTPMRWRPME